MLRLAARLYASAPGAGRLSLRHQSDAQPLFSKLLWWLEIYLIGTRSNRDGVGARVKVVAGDKVSYGERKGA